MRQIGVGDFYPSGKTVDLVSDVVKSGRISYGPMCKKLEEQISSAHGCAYGVSSASGTDSLRAALHAMKIIHGWEDGDEVIVPATTFVATINVVLQLNMTPVLVDVIPVHYTIDPWGISEVVTDRTRAIIPVNLLGQAANLSDVKLVADMFDLRVIEDSCEAMFASHLGKPVGSWGDIGCFSFYMAHLVTAGVGGMAVTNREVYANVMRSLLNHGRDTVYTSIDDDIDSSGEVDASVVRSRFLFHHVGYSSRMTELQAALALPQVRTVAHWLSARRDIAYRLTEGLSGVTEIEIPFPMHGNTHSWMMYGITVRDGSKWPLVDHLERSGVETRELLPILGQPVYEGMFDESKYPVSAKAIKSAFYVGCHQGMTYSDVDYIVERIKEHFAGHKG